MHPLRAYRERQGLTQRQLAQILGVSDAFVTHIETGKRRAPPERCMAWERLTGVSRHDLRPDVFGLAPDADCQCKAAA